MSKATLPIRFAFRKAGAALLGAALALALFAAPAAGQGKSSGVYLAEAFTRVTGNADQAKRLVGYGYNEGISVMAAWVRQGEKVTFKLTLTGGVQYMFLAGGDLDALDVDLFIRDSQGNVVAKDDRVDPDAAVGFTPPVTAEYIMEVLLFQSKRGVPCICAATILKKGGWNLPLANLDQAARNFVDVLSKADNELQRRFNKRLDLHREPGQWGMFGAVLPQGQTTDVFNLSLGRGRRAFFATGDNNAQDVDLFLLDNNGTRTIKEDVRTDRDASFVHEPGPGLHRLRIRNFQSNGNSLVVMGVFDIIE
jgi:hypothetical protein